MTSCPLNSFSCPEPQQETIESIKSGPAEMSLIVDGLVNPDCRSCLGELTFSLWRLSHLVNATNKTAPNQSELPVSVVAGLCLEDKFAPSSFSLGFSQWCDKEFQMCSEWHPPAWAPSVGEGSRVTGGTRTPRPRVGRQGPGGKRAEPDRIHMPTDFCCLYFPRFSSVRLCPPGGALVHRKIGKGQTCLYKMG